ncbi:aspartyl protease family protein [Sphingomonas faeni]|uniref:aspartyl protease family protein n=1 Tax=Sphingomonas faeni TaxID=185950 RepID=UPI003357FB5C
MKRIFAAAALASSVMAMPAAARTTYVDIQYRQVSGTRPFIPARLGQTTLLMMVHSGAGFYMMTNHEHAKAIGLKDLQDAGKYGITSVGHVSPLGRVRAVLPSLVIGGKEVKNAPLLVFETPQDPPMDGMLGLGWLNANKVLLDFDKNRVGIPDTSDDTTAGDRELEARGYVGHKMIRGKDGYYVNGTVNGAPARISINTVMNNVIEAAFAKRSGIQLGPVVDEAGGPKGAVLPVRISKYQLDVAIDGQTTAPTQPLSWDTAAYHSEAAGSAEDDLQLGSEFMLANQAVIDFGSETLFLPRRPSRP